MNKLSSLNKSGGKVILWFLILAMFGFTVVRTLHFLSMTMPPDQAYVAYLALAAFDLGVLGWLYYAMHSAEGVSQRVIAYGMIFICAGGVLVTTIADMLMVSAKNGVTNKLPPDIATVALWAVIIVISLNFFAGILVHLVDTKHAKHMAVESARDQITSASLAAITSKAGELAPHIAERVALAWQEEVIREMLGSLPPAKEVAQLMASNKTVLSNPVTVTPVQDTTVQPGQPAAASFAQTATVQTPTATPVQTPVQAPAKKKRGRPAKQAVNTVTV